MYVANIFLASQTDYIFVEPLFITEFKQWEKKNIIPFLEENYKSCPSVGSNISL